MEEISNVVKQRINYEKTKNIKETQNSSDSSDNEAVHSDSSNNSISK